MQYIASASASLLLLCNIVLYARSRYRCAFRNKEKKDVKSYLFRWRSAKGNVLKLVSNTSCCRNSSINIPKSVKMLKIAHLGEHWTQNFRLVALMIDNTVSLRIARIVHGTSMLTRRCTSNRSERSPVTDRHDRCRIEQSIKFYPS